MPSMRISELAQAGGVPLATVKYYLREGLLPPGHPAGPRLSTYDDAHVQRLRLLRTLREVGGVPIDRLRDVVDALGSRRSMHDVFGAAADALSPATPPPGPRRAEARRIADEVVSRAGWQVRPGSPDRDHLTAVVERLWELQGAAPAPELLGEYVDAADRLARTEIAALDGTADRVTLLEQMVVGQVVLGRALEVLRRMAEEHHSRTRFG